MRVVQIIDNLAHVLPACSGNDGERGMEISGWNCGFVGLSFGPIHFVSRMLELSYKVYKVYGCYTRKNYLAANVN